MEADSFRGAGWRCRCGVYICPDNRDKTWTTHHPNGEHRLTEGRRRILTADGWRTIQAK